MACFGEFVSGPDFASGMRKFAIALPTQRTEAILEGMSQAFEFFGCVSKEVWWDNPRTVADAILSGCERKEPPPTASFAALKVQPNALANLPAINRKHLPRRALFKTKGFATRCCRSAVGGVIYQYLLLSVKSCPFEKAFLVSQPRWGSEPGPEPFRPVSFHVDSRKP